MWGMNKQRRNQRDGTWMIPRNKLKKNMEAPNPKKMALGAKQWKIQRAQILWTIWKTTVLTWANWSFLTLSFSCPIDSHCIPRARLLGDGDLSSQFSWLIYPRLVEESSCPQQSLQLTQKPNHNLQINHSVTPADWQKMGCMPISDFLVSN